MVAKKSVTEPVTAPAAVAPVAAPKKEKSSKKAAKETTDDAAAPAPAVAPKKEKSSKKAAPAPVPADAPATAEGAVAAEAPAAETVISSLERLAAVEAKLHDLAVSISSLRSEAKLLSRSFAKELRAAQKSSRRKNSNAGNSKPIGFTKPTVISDELALFIGVEAGQEISRVEVCKRLYAYIKEKSLQDPTNGRFIVPDAALTKLLRIKSAEQRLSYFNLQAFLGDHFPKTAKAVAAAESA